jgi:thioredoxin-like negative regulator of GroEL
MVAPVLEEIAEEQAGRLIVGKRNIDDDRATADTGQVQSIPSMGLFCGGELVELIVGVRPKPAINGRVRGVLTMTPHLDRARPADAGRQHARVDAVLATTGETRQLEIGLGVAVRHPPLTEPVPPMHVVHRSVAGISRLGTRTVHAVLPGPGGAA